MVDQGRRLLLKAFALRVALACSIVAIAELPGALAATRSCTSDERAEADAQLWLNRRDQTLSLKRHLPWGAPENVGDSTNESLLVQRDYVINYDADLLIPLWTAHRIDASKLGESDRINCFRRDPRIDAAYVSRPADYEEPIFDQGHMTPNGDMSLSDIAVINSFVMSNMTPQFCQFNRGVWQILESLVRHWAQSREFLYVITGSILDRDGDGRRDQDDAARRMKSKSGKMRVALPTHFFKVIASQRTNGDIETLTLILPHDQTDLDGAPAIEYLAEHIRSLADLQSVTGLKFFEKLERQVHEAATPDLWDTAGAPIRSLVTPKCRETAGADGN